MDFEGVVFRKLPEVSGTSAKGTWRKQDVVFELPSEFSRKICVTFFGDRAEDVASLQEGEAVTVSVNVESREYNGKWYTDVKAWKIIRKGGSDAGAGSSGYGAGAGSGSGSGSGYNAGGGSGSGSNFGPGTSAGTSGYASSSTSGRSGSGSSNNRKAASSHFSDAPFNESTAPAPTSADEVDDLPF